MGTQTPLALVVEPWLGWLGIAGSSLAVLCLYKAQLCAPCTGREQAEGLSYLLQSLQAAAMASLCYQGTTGLIFPLCGEPGATLPDTF